MGLGVCTQSRMGFRKQSLPFMAKPALKSAEWGRLCAYDHPLWCEEMKFLPKKHFLTLQQKETNRCRAGRRCQLEMQMWSIVQARREHFFCSLCNVCYTVIVHQLWSRFKLVNQLHSNKNVIKSHWWECGVKNIPHTVEEENVISVMP